VLAAAVGLNRAYPQLKLDGILNDAGKQAVADIASQCVEQFAAKYAFKKNRPITRRFRTRWACPGCVHPRRDSLGRRIPAEPNAHLPRDQ